MKTEAGLLAKLFSPSLLQKAVSSFDKATIVVVATCWGGALMLMVVALYTVHLSIAAKQRVVELVAMEPSVPEIINKPPESKEIEPLVERMKGRFPEIKFEGNPSQGMIISAVDGAQFRTWLTVLNYMDTISPQYRWQIKELCVGMACSGSIMRAVLLPKKITFSTGTSR